MRLKHPKFQLTEKKIWTGQKMSHKFFREIKETVNKLEHVLQLVNETQLAVTNRQKENLALHFICYLHLISL